jgi:alcohol dehydrogenase (cytochrome c)
LTLTSDPNSRPRWPWAAVGVAVLGLVLTASLAPKVRQGLAIVRLKATGSLPDIGWMDLVRMVRSGSHFNLPELARTSNPYSAIRNPYSSPEDVSAGSEVFQTHCATCHAANGSGGPGGPALRGRQMVNGDSDWAIFRVLSFGVRGTAMPPSDVPWLDKWRLVAYVQSLMAAAEAPTGSKDASVISAPEPVLYNDILRSGQFEDRWLTYSGTYDSQRFSSAKQITAVNVNGLRLLWMRQYSVSQPSIETSPLVVGDVMFVTVPPNRVEAIDDRTGALIWAYDRSLPAHLSLCCGYQNRGLAVLGGTLFFGTLDAHLVALDIRTGRPLWDVTIADYAAGYSITGAPLALKNLVITGVAGGEFGARGFIDARDATTGKEVWRFDSIPQPGQPGADTWKGDAWKTGGGPTWMTGSFDPDLNVLYWPIGNASPEFNGDVRMGDNLYTNCVVALDADHGTLRWYFQFGPHDEFDWDATEILVLINREVSGKPLRLLAQANRNGFLYLLDRETGRFLHAQPFGKQTWADGVDSHGHPIERPGAHPTVKGTAIYPGVGGATDWQSPSYSPVTGSMYVSALDWGGIFYQEHDSYHRGELFLGGSFEYFSSTGAQSVVRSLNPLTGDVQWEYRNTGYSAGGLLATAGGIVFGSQENLPGNSSFFALDANTGHELWRISAGGRIVAAPISFLCKGRQMVTIAAGHDILTFGL